MSTYSEGHGQFGPILQVWMQSEPHRGSHRCDRTLESTGRTDGGQLSWPDADVRNSKWFLRFAASWNDPKNSHAYVLPSSSKVKIYNGGAGAGIDILNLILQGDLNV